MCRPFGTRFLFGGLTPDLRPGLLHAALRGLGLVVHFVSIPSGNTAVSLISAQKSRTRIRGQNPCPVSQNRETRTGHPQNLMALYAALKRRSSTSLLAAWNGLYATAGIDGRRLPQGLKRVSCGSLAARLKSCPSRFSRRARARSRWPLLMQAASWPSLRLRSWQALSKSAKGGAASTDDAASAG